MRTGDGDLHPIMSGYVVNAAGAWGGELARMANIGVGDDLLAIPLPVQPRCVQLSISSHAGAACTLDMHVL